MSKHRLQICKLVTIWVNFFEGPDKPTASSLSRSHQEKLSLKKAQYSNYQVQKSKEKPLGTHPKKIWQRFMCTTKPPDPLRTHFSVLSNRAGCLDYVQIRQMLRLD